MSRLISPTGLRRIQTLSSVINRPQISQGSRNISTRYCSNKNVIIASRANSILSSSINFMSVPYRGLYSAESLGLDKLQWRRDNRMDSYKNKKDKYVSRLASYLDSGNVESILKEDIYNLISLAENEQHLDLIERMIESLKSEYNFSQSGFGTALMRLYCTLGFVDRAYNNLKDYERFGEFFNQYTAYRIALTMLYNAGRYDDVVEIFLLVRDKVKPSLCPALAVVAFAALAKTDSPTALEEAGQLYSEVDLRMYSIPLATRVIGFLAYMAVKKDKPALALNLISEARGKNYVALRELKTVSLLRLKRYEDVESHLQDALSRRKESMSTEEKPDLILRESIENSLGGVDEMSKDALINILVQLGNSKLVGEATLESLVFAPFAIRGDPCRNLGGRRMQDPINSRMQLGRTNKHNFDRFDGSDNGMIQDIRSTTSRHQGSKFLEALTNILDESRNSKSADEATLNSRAFAPIGNGNYHSNMGISGKQNSKNTQALFTRANNYNFNRFDGFDNSRTNDLRSVPSRQQRGNYGRHDPNDFLDRPQQGQSKSYFEDKYDSEVDSDAATQRLSKR